MGRVGTPADAAMWDMAFTDESAAAVPGVASMAVLLDIKRCYEQVQHEPLWTALVATGFPMALARLALYWYTQPRRIVVDKHGTEEFRIPGTIVAGCGFATRLLRAMVIFAVDPVKLRFPLVHFRALVDDIAAQKRSPP